MCRRVAIDQPVGRFGRAPVAVAAVLAAGIAAGASDPGATLVTVARDRASLSGDAQVTQSYLLLPVDTPRAVVVLLPGGSGRLDLGPDGPARGVNNFLVRSRALFASRGLAVALMDAASDFRQRTEGLRGQRLGAQHLSDIGAVIADLRGRYRGVPVWLVGTSRGAVSAAAAAVALGLPPAGPQGVVLTSPVTRGSARDGDALADVALAAIAVPVLLVAHAQDRCSVSPPSDLGALQRQLAQSAVRVFDGGEAGDGSRPCNARGPHGFLAIEPTVVDFIAAWIRDR